jgi:hypothetical protein
VFEYRVTKYDPTRRDARGAYTREEWTSFGDIGQRLGKRRGEKTGTRKSTIVVHGRSGASYVGHLSICAMSPSFSSICAMSPSFSPPSFSPDRSVERSTEGCSLELVCVSPLSTRMKARTTTLMLQNWRSGAKKTRA